VTAAAAAVAAVLWTTLTQVFSNMHVSYVYQLADAAAVAATAASAVDQALR
jgi:hypothetical protein